MYPLYPRKPFIVLANISDPGDVYETLETTMKLWKWGGWFGCSWQRIPAFGAL